jgi:drug/metabolite transporter (DMT)-like permease
LGLDLHTRSKNPKNHLSSCPAVVTMVLFAPVLFFKKEFLQELTQIDKKTFALILITVLLTILADILILSGVKYLNASTASLIEISYPFFVVLFSFFAFRTAISLPVLFGGLLIFAGSLVIIRYGS